MPRFTYTVVLIPEGDDYVVHVPALPGAVTQGGSVEEALAMAADLIRVWLHGEPPRPEPDGVRAQLATVTVKVEIVDGVVRAPGVTELARAQRTRIPPHIAEPGRRDGEAPPSVAWLLGQRYTGKHSFPFPEGCLAGPRRAGSVPRFCWFKEGVWTVPT